MRRTSCKSLPRSVRVRAVALAASAAALVACGGAPAGDQEQTVALAEKSSGWEVLFDGTDLSRWRGYRREAVPSAWKIEDGALTLVPGSGEGGDIMTREQYGDFELELEWKISPRGNSGIIYRVVEDYPNSYESGPEYQILDNAGHPDGKNGPLTSAAANYALYGPSEDVTRPVGEWNHARIVAHGPHVEHWLNGVKVVEYEVGSEDWKQRVAASKFAAMPGYGKHLKGHIVLQDHGDRVWYRNIRIRHLDSGQ